MVGSGTNRDRVEAGTHTVCDDPAGIARELGGARRLARGGSNTHRRRLPAARDDDRACLRPRQARRYCDHRSPKARSKRRHHGEGDPGGRAAAGHSDIGPIDCHQADRLLPTTLSRGWTAGSVSAPGRPQCLAARLDVRRVHRRRTGGFPRGRSVPAAAAIHAQLHDRNVRTDAGRLLYFLRDFSLALAYRSEATLAEAPFPRNRTYGFAPLCCDRPGYRQFSDCHSDPELGRRATDVRFDLCLLVLRSWARIGVAGLEQRPGAHSQ